MSRLTTYLLVSKREFKSRNERFIGAFILDLHFDFSHENTCKSYCRFGAHRISVRLQAILFVNWDEFSCKISLNGGEGCICA